LKEEAEGYKARVIAQAEGDAQRFRLVHAEYQRAPQVTRDRMYLETMQQIYANVTKVMVDSKQGSNLLYLPLDKIMQQASGTPGDAPAVAPPVSTAPAPAAGANDARARENSRGRERDAR
jgi:membrane protease subunit HflK